MSDPKYCRVDKAELLRREEPYFNAYTGEDEPFIFLECPMWQSGRDNHVPNWGAGHDRYQFFKKGRGGTFDHWLPLE